VSLRQILYPIEGTSWIPIPRKYSKRRFFYMMKGVMIKASMNNPELNKVVRFYKSNFKGDSLIIIPSR
tara:strand:+ start:1332 stop:1535 length:204 start_codon:yes stop_codon:yes gene_type:complete